MVGDAQIGFNINNEQFGWHSDLRSAKKNLLHVRIYWVQYNEVAKEAGVPSAEK